MKCADFKTFAWLARLDLLLSFWWIFHLNPRLDAQLAMIVLLLGFLSARYFATLFGLAVRLGGMSLAMSSAWLTRKFTSRG